MQESYLNVYTSELGAESKPLERGELEYENERSENLRLDTGESLRSFEL